MLQSSSRPEAKQMRLLRIVRHRPYIYVAVFLVSLVLVWHVQPHQYISTSFLNGAAAASDESAPSTPALAPDLKWVRRAEDVKSAFLHAYHGWEEYAAPHDELLPLSKAHKDPFNGWGISAVDSLDTMLLMKLDAEYARAVARVSNLTFPMNEGKFAPYFETVIRYLGGFLSAYALSGDRVLLGLAEDLAEKLDPVFDHFDSPFPVYGVNTVNGKLKGGQIGGLAEIGTLQVEYLYLAKATGNRRWYERAAGVMNALATADVRKYGGMLPLAWNLTTSQPIDCNATTDAWLGNVCPLHLSVGAMADSAHEYLLKQYLLTSSTDQQSLDMYLRASTHILTNLLYVSPQRNMLYMTDTSSTTDVHGARPSHDMEHLSCFLPGLLALGVHALPLDELATQLPELGKEFGWASRGYDTLSKEPSLRELHLWAAKGLAETCYMVYADQASGLSPDQITFDDPSLHPETTQDRTWEPRLWIDEVHEWRKTLATNTGTFKGHRFPPGVEEKHQPVNETSKGRDYLVSVSRYLLRPETVESLYILWRVTGEERWREMGWNIFKAIERETRTSVGYASLETIYESPAPQADDMPSYFLAETLKYLYLLFLEDDPVPLDKWVFNTEAHPLPIFRWTAEEKQKFQML